MKFLLGLALILSPTPAFAGSPSVMIQARSSAVFAPGQGGRETCAKVYESPFLALDQVVIPVRTIGLAVVGSVVQEHEDHGIRWAAKFAYSRIRIGESAPRLEVTISGFGSETSTTVYLEGDVDEPSVPRGQVTTGCVSLGGGGTLSAFAAFGDALESGRD